MESLVEGWVVGETLYCGVRDDIYRIDSDFGDVTVYDPRAQTYLRGRLQTGEEVPVSFRERLRLLRNESDYRLFAPRRQIHEQIPLETAVRNGYLRQVALADVYKNTGFRDMVDQIPPAYRFGYRVSAAGAENLRVDTRPRVGGRHRVLYDVVQQAR